MRDQSVFAWLRKFANLNRQFNMELLQLMFHFII